MKKFGANTADIGYFSIASLMIVGPNLLVAMVAPVLFNRWSKVLTAEKIFPILKNILIFSIMIQALGLFFWPFLSPIIIFIFGADFAQTVPLMSILLFSVLAVLATRGMTPAFQGIGKNNWVTYSCGTRFIAILMGLLTLALPETQMNTLETAAWSWVLGEYAALIILTFAAQRVGSSIRSSSSSYQ